jgi:hypothetical protein
MSAQALTLQNSLPEQSAATLRRQDFTPASVTPLDDVAPLEPPELVLLDALPLEEAEEVVPLEDPPAKRSELSAPPHAAMTAATDTTTTNDEDSLKVASRQKPD